MAKLVIISGSARSDGDTMQMVNKLSEMAGWDLVDLNDYDFSYYDYNHKNRNDDFIGLMRNIIENYEVLIFATPVYWYSMSGIMKVFFDRITDLITIEKELGRRLGGKKMGVITVSSGGNLGESFWLPFTESANYLGIDYLGNVHTLKGINNDEILRGFIDQIENNRNSTS